MDIVKKTYSIVRKKQHFLIDADSFSIIYLVVIYPLISISVSSRAVLLMVIPLLVRLAMDGSAIINRKMLPLIIIPLLAILSGGKTAIAYGCKIGVTLLVVSTLRGNLDRNYNLFIKTVKVNGIVVLITMLFQIFLKEIAIPIYTPIWSLYLEGDKESLLYIIANTKTCCYGIIPNASYAANSLTFALGLYVIDFKKNKNKMISLLLFLGIIITSKRSYMVFVTITLFFLRYIVCERRLRRKRIKEGLLIIATVIGVWIIIEPFINYSPTGFGKLLASIKYFNDPVYIEKYYIRAERDTLSLYAFNIFKQNWLFGVGWGNFSKIYTKNMGIWVIDAHNTYIQILCESGLFAGMIIIGIMYREFIQSIKLINQERKSNYYFAYIITFIIMIMITAFIFDLQQFYVILFLCVYFMRNKQYRKIKVK